MGKMTSQPDNHGATAGGRAASDADVTILGTGITGTLLAAALARNGLSVQLLGEDHHPRITGGEATLPCTSFLYELIAARYRLPEAALLADAGRVRTEVSHASGIHRTWGFVHHEAGHEHRAGRSLQFNVPSEHGESHFHRPDLDAWLLAAAARRGVRVRQRTRVDKAVTEDGFVRLALESGGELRTGLVIDTQGPDSAVARAIGAERVSTRATRTYGFHAVGVQPYERLAAPRPGSHPWSQGTLTHVFDGGWLQVGHFRNAEGTPPPTVPAVVTLSLDAARHPAPAGHGTQELWREVLRHAERHPAVAAQLAGAQPLTGWIEQDPHWRASHTVGERMLLLDRAALGGDPLLGRDLYASAQLVLVAAGDVLAGARDGDFSPGRFRYLERLQHGMADRHDALVAAALTASGSFDLWSALARVWLLGTMFDALSLKRSAKELAAGGSEAALAGLRADPATGACHQGIPEYRDLLDFTLALCRAAAEGDQSPRQAADRILLRLRHDRIVPPIYGFGDPDDLEYVLSLQGRLRTLRWVRGQALPSVRRLVRPYGLRGGGKDLGHDE
jgi:FADH2 O2-dependent halogenase